MEIATWNVNSIRSRLEQVKNWLLAHPQVELLAVQETKVTDSDFPTAPLQELGYHVYCWGQKSYNGVAFITKKELATIKRGFASVLPQAKIWDEQKRVIAALWDDILIVNLYCPNGSAIGSDKYAYKLEWFQVLKEYLQVLQAEQERIILCGDFNVALTDLDIHDPTARETKVMASDAERSALQSILDLGFVDILRKFHPEPGHYTWWDYRSGAWRRNWGWRIDYHFVSLPLVDRVSDAWIDPAPRRLPQPSDHTPVVLQC
ncbi:MAG: exodeoxyribonuclease III [Pseudanabaenaceae cyanobacterium SKYGB_i_bin29]|nr:exodeoxyribonuclease III [Pseudanabaenaceae cyanobacterium SKYG29]MDW8421985.1 exodeoxyribonuclease III [Pseudanabaenaceae cyanobacterium SKYGB_i_bin29]